MIDLHDLTQSVGELDEEKVLEILNNFMSTNPSSEDAQEAVSACQKGMVIVGERFETGEYFVGDLIFAGEVLTNAIEILKPILSEAGGISANSIVIGTVAGDLHDIGKNIFKSMAEAAGFKIHDIGIDQAADAFVEKVKEVKPKIVGMSGVLTLSLESMKNTVDALAKEGLRDSVKIIIGGNPVTKEACIQIGADAFTTNAADGINICREWIK